MSKPIYWVTQNYINTRQAFEPEKPARRLPPVVPLPAITHAATHHLSRNHPPQASRQAASQPSQIATAAKQAN